MAIRAVIDEVTAMFPRPGGTWLAQVNTSVYDDVTGIRLNGVSTQAVFAWAASATTLKTAIANQVKADVLQQLGITLGVNNVLFATDFSVL